MMRLVLKGMLRVRGRWVLLGVAAPAAILLACSDPTKKPGFMQLGGAGGLGSTTSSAQSSTHTTAAQTSAVTATSATQASTTTNVTTVTSSTGTPCNDTGPGVGNDTEGTAYNLGDIDDCDGSGSSVSGVVPDGLDEDWYRYHGKDTTGCIVDPTVNITSAYPLRICMFAQCDNNNTMPNFGCPSGTDMTVSPVGRPGCCSTQGFTIDVTCTGSSLGSDSSTIFIRVDNPQASPCASYDVSYHF